MTKSVERVIEFVCSANRSRSVMAELIANAYLKHRNIPNYVAVSSVINVQNISQVYSQPGQMPEGFCRQVIHIAIERSRKKNDLFSESQISELEGLSWNETFRDSGLITLQNYAFSAVKIFDYEENLYRPEALYRLGFLDKLKKEPEQTKVRSDSSLILGMSLRHAEFVRKLYTSHKGDFKIPPIDTLGNYAYLRDIKIEDGYGKGLSGYIWTATILKDCINKTLEKYFSLECP